VNDQADSLREWASTSIPPGAVPEAQLAKPARARSIAVTSGKGGVGKTNLAVNIALAAARRRHRTILIDADYGLANADLILDVEPKWNLSHVLAGEVDPRAALVEGPGGVRLLAGSSGIRRFADLDDEGREAAARVFETLAWDADLLVIDTGAGIARSVIATAAAADEILVATCPEPPAIADAYAVIKSIAGEGDHGRVWVVVNRAVTRSEAAVVAGRIAEVARDFLGVDVRWAGHIPEDPCVPLAVKRRRPFLTDFPDSPASTAIGALLDALRLDERAPAGRGWLARLGLRREGARA